METFGERLTRLRNERDWSVYHAAKEIGIASQLLGRLEARQDLGNVSARVLAQIARVYRVSVDYLIATDINQAA